MRTLRRRFTAMLAFGAGIFCAYLLDPDRGRARRARLADQALAEIHRMMRTAETRARYARNRRQGLRYQAEHPTMPPTDDATLVQKIRSEVLGRGVYHDLQISIDACDGVVHLRGAVDDITRAFDLAEAVAQIPGVRSVDNLLHRPGQPAPNKISAITAG